MNVKASRVLLIISLALLSEGIVLINQYQFSSNQLKYLHVFLTIPDGLENT
jgi:hypothetical protein